MKPRRELCCVLLLLLLLSSCDTPTGQSIVERGRQVPQDVAQASRDMLLVGDSLFNSTERQRMFISSKLEMAALLSSIVREGSLEPIDAERLVDFEYYVDSVDNINLLLRLLSEKSGFDFIQLNPSYEAHAEFSRNIEKYSPLIDNYNDLIVASKGFDGTERSADSLLTEAAAFSFELGAIAYDPLHQAVFLSVGRVGAYSGFLQVARVCRTCVSALYGLAYWTEKNTMVELTGDTVEEWLRRESEN